MTIGGDQGSQSAKSQSNGPKEKKPVKVSASMGSTAMMKSMEKAMQ